MDTKPKYAWISYDYIKQIHFYRESSSRPHVCIYRDTYGNEVRVTHVADEGKPPLFKDTRFVGMVTDFIRIES